MMDLKTWAEKRGRGALSEIQGKTGYAYSTIHRAFRGLPVTYPTAAGISLATGGEVTIPELCDPAGEIVTLDRPDTAAGENRKNWETDRNTIRSAGQAGAAGEGTENGR